MTKSEKFVKSVYPRAEIQPTMTGSRSRVVSSPVGTFLGESFEHDAKNKWASAAKALRQMMLRKLEQ